MYTHDVALFCYGWTILDILSVDTRRYKVSLYGRLVPLLIKSFKHNTLRVHRVQCSYSASNKLFSNISVHIDSSF